MTGTAPHYCRFDRLIAMVDRNGIVAGEVGEVTRVYGDGSVELEIRERADPPTFVLFGLLPNKMPFTRCDHARFAAGEVQRAG